MGILLDPKKGVLVFSVKNTGGKSDSPNKVQEDLEKHCHFVETLTFDFKGNLPVYGVVCSKQKTLNPKNFPANFVLFGKSDFDNFGLKFSEKIDQLPSCNMDENSVDILVARLTAVNTMGSSLALIHDKITSNSLQTMHKNENQTADLLQKQFSDEQPRKIYEKTLETDEKHPT